VTNPLAASGITKPGRKTRAKTTNQSTTRAAAKVEAAKTTKLEADKKKRKRRASPPPAVRTPVIPTLATKEVDVVEYEATDDLSFVEDRTTRRSLSPAAKRKRELEQQVMAYDLRCMREAQRAATDV
jgi:hypothetical protein